MHNSVTIKLVVFSVTAGQLDFYLTHGQLPSVTFIPGETLDHRVEDLLKTVSTVQGYVEQLYTFSNPTEGGSDLIVTYFVLLPSKVGILGWATWKNQTDPSVDFNIIRYAVKRLQWKIEYTNLAYSLLPSEFTLSDLQRVYEAILGRALDKRNFRKKILSLKLLKPTGNLKKGIKARPASIYQFLHRSPQIVKIFS